MITSKPINRKAFEFFQEGLMCLAEVEQNGIRVDTKYFERMLAETEQELKRYNKAVKQSALGKAWLKHFGGKAKFSSADQLSELLYDVMKMKPLKTTESDEKGAADDEVLRSLSIQGAEELIQFRKYSKAHGTYITGILRETVDGWMYPFFHLNLVRTFRSSSSDPNFQNMPIRDKFIGQLIRSGFYPQMGHHFGEFDYSGIEVKVAHCYHRDPVMAKYLADPVTNDMHRDSSMDCYMLSKDQVTKDIRYCGKNKFVFPQFYGSYYELCAVALWNAVHQMKLKRADGMPLLDHLKEKGIGNLAKFTKHIREVEDFFWNSRFKVYTQWRKQWYAEYLKKGYFESLTGFRYTGVMRRNAVLNYAIQGSAFHCLLWSLIRMHRWLKKERMETYIMGQVHDSLLSSIAAGELVPYYNKANKVMRSDLPAAWPWLIVPLDIEAEIAPVNEPWFKKTLYPPKAA